ncbi:hypothetical protein BASA81_009865 [Batrachochytrium salamandrivorans]|nr:hypothetical protein BASA81_009865 [Batrachochytrium salamandrivorans]
MKPSRYAVKPLVVGGLPPRFVQLGEDECTRQFLQEAKTRRSAVKDNVANLLKQYAGYSTTDANGTVDRGRMFIFGNKHIDLLLPQLSTFSSEGRGKRARILLDVGAGDGNVTAKFAPQFDKVVCTEFSLPMVSRLRKRGFTATTAKDDTFQNMGKRSIDLVMFLNVLDRADRPLTMLKALKELLVPGTGRLLVAVVLPWCPFVEDGGKQRRPSEHLPMRGGKCKEKATFESSVKTMVDNVFTPMGLEVESWSKLPYLCEGEQGGKEWYVLDDAIFVLKVKEEAEEGEVVFPSVFKEPQTEEEGSGLVNWLAQKVW